MTKKTKNINQTDAYRRVEKLAEAAGMSLSAYAESKGVSRFYIAKWKDGKGRTIPLDKAVALGLV